MQQRQGRAALAQLTGKRLQQICAMLDGKKSFGERVARDIEKKIGLELGALDRIATPVEVQSGNLDDLDPQVPVVLIPALEVKKYETSDAFALWQMRFVGVEKTWLYSHPISTANPTAVVGNLPNLPIPGGSLLLSDRPEHSGWQSPVATVAALPLSLPSVFYCLA